MRVFFFLIFTLSLNITFSQEKSDINYTDAIQIIKKSEVFLAYSKEFNCSNNFKVSNINYSICEFLTIIEKSKISKEVFEYCEDTDWINLKDKKNKLLNGKSDCGKKTIFLRFTEIVDNFVFAEIKTNNKLNNKSIIYLFRIEENKFKLITSNFLFYD